jgi:glycine/D-amino acid oxidase-like deaminating enzyme
VTTGLPRGADVVVIGAGIVGACCADALTRAGRSVVVVERGALTGGTTAAGEGNLLVSDKTPGPELDLALDSLRRWRELGEELGTDELELEPKGGLIVAQTEAGHAAMTTLAAEQRAAGVTAEALDPDGARELEPHLTRELVGGVAYPQDAQVQPVRALAAVLRRARSHGAVVASHTEVTGIERTATGAVAAVVTDRGRVATHAVVDAAGVHSPEVAALVGRTLPVAPRRGQILVTEPLPPMIRRKVYDADYVGTVGGDPTAEGVSTVVEGTASGTILIGSSRELVGFDRTPNLPLLARMAARALALFPVLAGAVLLRTYLGFRPYPPDHLPIIGADAEVAGLWHATGHEGAGIGLAPGTGALLAALLTGATPSVAPEAFAPSRFEELTRA